MLVTCKQCGVSVLHSMASCPACRASVELSPNERMNLARELAPQVVRHMKREEAEKVLVERTGLGEFDARALVEEFDSARRTRSRKLGVFALVVGAGLAKFSAGYALVSDRLYLTPFLFGLALVVLGAIQAVLGGRLLVGPDD